MKKFLPVIIVFVASISEVHGQTTPATQASQIAQKMSWWKCLIIAAACMEKAKTITWCKAW